MQESINIVTSEAPICWTVHTGQGTKNLKGVFQYSTTVVMPPHQAQVLLTQIQSLYDANTSAAYTCSSMGFKRCNSLGVNNQQDEYYSFKFKTNTTYPDGNPNPIELVNAHNVAFTLNEDIGNLTMACVKGILRYYRMSDTKADGVHLILRGIQITKLERRVITNAPSEGFVDRGQQPQQQYAAQAPGAMGQPQQNTMQAPVPGFVDHGQPQQYAAQAPVAQQQHNAAPAPAPLPQADGVAQAEQQWAGMPVPVEHAPTAPTAPAPAPLQQHNAAQAPVAHQTANGVVMGHTPNTAAEAPPSGFVNNSPNNPVPM